MPVEFVESTQSAKEMLTQLLRVNNIVDPNFGEADLGIKLTELASQFRQPATAEHLAKFITQDEKMLLLKDQVRLLAAEPDPVLITGPTGTGKEHIAQALHGNREGPFLPLNCGGLPEHLIESELFGHVQGAFTDAKVSRTGILRAAANGTVFLDEVAELPIHLQAKLLRAIQFNKVRPVGAPREEDISCRFVAATKHDLKELVNKQEFRDDLYARLFIFELRTTPLIPDREGDIPLILESLQCDTGLPDSWRPLVQQFNVRALVAYARRLRVLGVAHV